jgi:hypothetical protein
MTKWWSGLVELETTYNGATAGVSEYIKYGKGRLTRLVEEYDVGKTKYPLQKYASLIKQKYDTRNCFPKYQEST